MIKFKGVRPQEEIVKQMKKLGYVWTEKSKDQYNNHFSDYNGFVNFKKNKFVMVNTFNGTFWVNELSTHNRIADTSSDLDNEKWYVDILNAINIPLEEISISHIRNVQDIKDFLQSTSNNNYCCYYCMQDEFNNPTIRVLEDWEIGERMSYSFQRIQDGNWCWKNSNKLVSLDELANQIFNIIMSDY